MQIMQLYIFYNNAGIIDFIILNEHHIIQQSLDIINKNNYIKICVYV